MPTPLSGLRVIEMGSLIAGPFAAKTLADFGADVIKIEPPAGGDPLRTWRTPEGETSVWWHVQSRNKRSLALDLKHPEGQALVRRLAAEADVVIENFRPGTLEAWGLDFETLSRLNPRLIMLRISGYGQTGPMRDQPGFGVIAEAMGGLRHITGEPGRAPVRPAISIGDSLSALHGVIGLLMALYHRDVRGGQGQMVDVALYESVFNMMEGAVPEFDRFAMVRQPAGSTLPGVAPTNAYPCADGQFVLIAGNGDSIYRRLMALVGRDDLGGASELASNPGRVKAMTVIDEAIAAWTRQRSLTEALQALADAKVPAGRVFTVADMVDHPQFLAREMVREVSLPDGSTLRVPGIAPKLSATPGQINSLGPALGQHTAEILRAAGLSEEDFRRLHDAAVIA